MTLATFKTPAVYSAIVYDGPSMIDGKPIIGVLTHLGYKSATNSKIGNMAQLWILPKDEAPHLAVKSGKDASVCGNCPHRPLNGGSCYVTTFRAPRSVWQAATGGSQSYHTALSHHLLERAKVRELVRRKGKIRLGAWGDPAALPLDMVKDLFEGVPIRTGYTHQWRDVFASEWRAYIMASVDSGAEALEAKSKGWRYFRVSAAGDMSMLPGEILCPASDEAGKRTTCERCGLCAGASKQAKSIMIPAHGAGAKKHKG